LIFTFKSGAHIVVAYVTLGNVNIILFAQNMLKTLPKREGCLN